MEKKDSSSSFTIGNSAQERSWSYVPDCYVIPSSNRPSLTPETANVPVIDFSRLRQDATQRANAIKEIGNACHQVGFFQVSIAIFYTSFFKLYIVAVQHVQVMGYRSLLLGLA